MAVQEFLQKALWSTEPEEHLGQLQVDYYLAVETVENHISIHFLYIIHITGILSINAGFSIAMIVLPSTGCLLPGRYWRVVMLLSHFDGGRGLISPRLVFGHGARETH